MYWVRITTKGGGKLAVAEKSARAALAAVDRTDLARDSVEIALADNTVIELEELEALAASEKP